LFDKPSYANPLYRAYARLPKPLRRLALSFVPSGQRARLRYWGRGEQAVITAELAGLRPGTKWSSFTAGYDTVGMTERVVEIPWTLSRYAGEHRVLDVGPSNAVAPYLRHLTGLNIPELHGVDLSPGSIDGMIMAQADVREMPYEDSYFDLITCVSTLEHIGLDNKGYRIQAGLDTQGDVKALQELQRVLKTGGRLLITVPFGSLRHYGWFKQYDLNAWDELLRQTAFQPLELAFFGHTGSGWTPSDPAQLVGADYRAGGATGATGLLCAALRRGETS
jgi:SAM-dependent methyltransferase